MRQRLCEARHDYGTGRGPFPSSHAGTPTEMAHVNVEKERGKNEVNTHTRRNSRSLHLVQQITHFLEVRDMCTIGVQCTFTRCTLREWINEQLLRGTRMHLEMERAGHRVLPRLRGS